MLQLQKDWKLNTVSASGCMPGENPSHLQLFAYASEKWCRKITQCGGLRTGQIPGVLWCHEPVETGERLLCSESDVFEHLRLMCLNTWSPSGHAVLDAVESLGGGVYLREWILEESTLKVTAWPCFLSHFCLLIHPDVSWLCCHRPLLPLCLPTMMNCSLQLGTKKTLLP